jgi:large subunit ribosomal protein L5
MNVMKTIRLEKVTVNMGVGDAGPGLEKAQKIIQTITGKKVVLTKTHKRSTFGVAKGRPIGCKTTLRGKEALDFLRNVLNAVENTLKPSQFDSNGNFSFGVKEYIHIPGVKYDPDVGIVGMDVAVTLERPGFRVKKRGIRPRPIGGKHRIVPEEAMEWARKELGARIVE